jgi:hypothetical protein
MLPPGYTVLEDGTIIGKYGTPLKPQRDRDGYLEVRPYHNGRARTRRVHQLVCEAFHGERPSPEHEVRHLNGERTDNRASNLRWGTKAENVADMVRHGTAGGPKGSTHPNAKLSEQQVREIRARHDFGRELQKDLAKEYGVSAMLISRIVRRKSWLHI